MTPEQLSHAITGALTALVSEEAVSLDVVPSAVTVERPRSKEHGDYATNVALQLAKRAGTSPRALAELLADRLRGADGSEAVEVAGPGFLNITVAAAAQGQVAAEIVAAGAAYGHTETLAGQNLVGHGGQTVVEEPETGGCGHGHSPIINEIGSRNKGFTAA